MYSMVLFMVDRSFNGFLGSGEIPTSAVDKMADTSASGIRPVNVTNSERSRRSLSATRSSKQSPDPMRVKLMSRRPSRCTT